MDNLQIWVYIILGIVYLIGRAMKKPAQPPVPQKGRQGDYEPVDEPKPLTFEELLREITEAKEPTPPVSRPVQEYVNYDDEFEEEVRPEPVAYDYRKEDTYKAFEQSKYEAFNRPSYEETMKLEDTKIEFGKFKAFEEERGPSLGAEIASEFADADKVKRAFIMSEIFNRKYA